MSACYKQPVKFSDNEAVTKLYETKKN